MTDDLSSTVAVITSLDFAEKFNKRHDNVLHDIRNLMTQISPELRLYYFLEVDYTNERGKKYPCYSITERGKELLLLRYSGLHRVPYRLQEESALKTIEQLLGITLIRQFRVLSYRIDGYDSINNVAYEIDEPDHVYKTGLDIKRQSRIEEVLKCKFVRILL
jgi:Rha family phage regulatory protein